MSKWIHFEEMPVKKEQVTKAWAVLTKDHSLQIGAILWYGAWRKYCFYPQQYTVFEQDCLRDIAEFIETETRKHKEKRKAEKENAQLPELPKTV